MNLTDNEVLKFQRGTPIFIDDICAVYPAKIGEIVDIGYDEFQKYLGIIIAEKPTAQGKNQEMAALLDGITDFQYLILMSQLDKTTNNLLKSAFRFFTHEDVTFILDPPQIVVGPVEEKHILNEEKFSDLQRLIRRMYFVEQEGEEIIINPDDSEATKKLKMQMRANREKVRQAKARKAAREKSDLKFSDLIGSITINNCGLNMENIWNITYYAFHDQLKRMGWRDQFDMNNRAALAGAKLKKNQLKHWMRSIASNDK